MENKYHHMDESFKKAFDAFEVTPRPGLWDEIKIEMDTQPLDEAFEHNFADFEVQPKKQIWNNIEKHLPLNLFIKRHLHRLSKVAAVLLLVMVSITLFMDNSAHTTHMASQNTATEIQQPTDEAGQVQNQDFVFQIETKDEEKEEISRERTREIKRKKYAHQLWKSIIDDEDDFAGINEAKIKEVLKPIERLPLEDFAEILEQEKFRNLPGKNKDSTNMQAIAVQEAVAHQNITPPEEEELKIWIPLKVVEDYEVETLIQAYNQRN